ncbi:aspartyl-phosphate phosphatase Spo0E family protein [Paenibacillus caui]|uniref:aspartyl-phosphate phosphatase Spo0E family protein n=1 Tax=Paenibacillus caui TaxID=2873927 RepID=UPI001CA7C7A3|nr:aspartyl-phosphate phosphatase Spo0E family protein [Paenibacillus caui]
MTAQTRFSKGKTVRKSRINEDLHDTIENLRRELVEVSSTSGFTSEIVLELSQRLDKYLVLAQRQMRKSHDAGLEM